MTEFLLNRRTTLLLAAALVAALPATAGAREIGTCMDNRQVQALIASQQIKTWPAIKAMAGIAPTYQEVSPVRVCEQGGVPYYVVNVQGPRGEFRQLVLNAVDGSN